METQSAPQIFRVAPTGRCIGIALVWAITSAEKSGSSPR